MTTRIQAALRTNQHTIATLESKFAIKAKRHGRYSNLVLLKYNQIESPFAEPIVQECRGIILDEADDWRVVSRAFDKFFNEGEALAAPIDWSTARVQEKLDGCFRRSQSVCLWGGGTITMGELADGARPRLIGMNEAGDLVPSDVVAVKNNGTKKNWLRVTTERPTITNARQLLVTSNHHVFINGEFCPIGEARPGDMLTEFMVAPTAEVLHVMRASLLGDGSVSPCAGGTARFTTGHKTAHDQYSHETARWLGDFAVRSRSVTSGYGTQMTHVVSRTCASLADLRSEWYPNGTKRVPQDLMWLDDFAVAVWYMDDGSLSHHDGQQDRACFATNGFLEEDVRRLAARLQERYGVACTVYESRGWAIRINAGRDRSIDRFWDAIAPHIVDCMRYKLPEAWRTTAHRKRQSGSLAYARYALRVSKIEEVSHLDRDVFPSGSTGYDIQTTTANYFAGGVLVHNSLCVLYHYRDEWHVATSGTPDASGRIGMLQRAFADLFWEAFRAVMEASLPTTPELCYYFELTSPHNRVVVPHAETRLTLLGARHLASGLEIGPDVASSVLDDFPYVRQFSLTDSASIAASFATMSPLAQEGYVVCDAMFRRIKVKHPGYVALHHAKDGMGPRAFVDIARGNEVSEVVAAFPEFREELDRIRDGYDRLVAEVSADYERIRAIPAQKDFAREALKTRCSSALFCTRNGKAESVSAFMREMPADKVLELLGIRQPAQRGAEP